MVTLSRCSYPYLAFISSPLSLPHSTHLTVEAGATGDRVCPGLCPGDSLYRGEGLESKQDQKTLLSSISLLLKTHQHTGNGSSSIFVFNL